MNLDEQFLEMTDKIRLIEQVNENVIRFPDQNTLNTKVKQIRNPQKEISGGFYPKVENLYFFQIRLGVIGNIIVCNFLYL